MISNLSVLGGREIELAEKLDFAKCMRRMCAWYDGELLDRPSARFWRHCGIGADEASSAPLSLPETEMVRLDAEYQLDAFERGMRVRSY